MSHDSALADARELRTALLDHGVRQVSIELQVGRGPAADPWHARTFRAVMSHHIASRPSQGLTPGLRVVKEGRTGLPAPLCNAYGGYDLTARVLCMGWANHPGTGGPWAVPGGTIPKDNARPYAFGWEFEGGYEPYTDQMIDFMARCGAGTLQWLGEPVEAHGEHLTWAGSRKVDRLGFTTSKGREAIRHVLTAPPVQEDDMANVTDAEKRVLLDAAARVNGFLQQRYTVNGHDPAERTAPGAFPARALDSLDGAHLLSVQGKQLQAQAQEIADLKQTVAGLAAKGDAR